MNTAHSQHTGLVTTGSNGSEVYALPIAMTSGLIAAFLALAQLDNQIQQLLANVQQQMAKTMMGQDANGTFDLNNGLIKHMFDSTVAVGEDVKQGYTGQAAGNIIGLVGSGAAIASMAGSFGASVYSSRQINPELEAAQTHENELLSGPAAHHGAGNEQELDNFGRPSREVEARMEDMEHGVHSDQPNALDREARQQLRARKNTPAYKRALKAAKDHVKEVKNKMQGPQNAHQERLQYVQVGNSMVQAGGSFQGNSTQAGAEAEKAQDQGNADNFNLVKSQVSGSADQKKKEADDAHQDANQWMRAIAQAAQSQVHV